MIESIQTIDVNVKKNFNIPNAMSGINEAIGKSVYSLVVANFRKLNSERHRSPNDPKGWYNRVAESTDYISDENGASVLVFQTGIRQRLLGGTITPKNAKYLTIPAIPQALSMRARDFGNLQYIQFGRGQDAKKALIERNNLSAYIKKTGQKIKKDKKVQGDFSARRVLFWLVSSVTQSPDPTVLPTRSELTASAVSGAAKFIQARFGGRLNGARF